VAAKFEIRSPKAGEFRWVLVNQGRTLATSPAYSRRALAEKSIDSFRMAAIAAPVADLTLAPAKTVPGKVARVAGRLAAKAVVKGARAVEKVEKTAAEAPAAARSTAKRAAKKVETATKAAKPAQPAAKRAAPRKRTPRAG
jgi:uncharacterized protein YegP (UPF0339 family)